MKKNIIIIVIIIILAAIIWYNYDRNAELDVADDVMTDENTDMEDAESMDDMNDEDMEDDEDMNDTEADMDDTAVADEEDMEGPGEYLAYSTESVAQALKEGDNVALFFHADRCPTCQALDAEIMEREQEIPADVAIFKVDYDNSADLQEEYGVTSQHTIVVIDGQLNELDQMNGGDFDDVISLAQGS